MAFDPDEFGRLHSLYVKYGPLLQSNFRSANEVGYPPLVGDLPRELSESYQDALATAHAVYAYLLANPVESPSEQPAENHAIGLTSV